MINPKEHGKKQPWPNLKLYPVFAYENRGKPRKPSASIAYLWAGILKLTSWEQIFAVPCHFNRVSHKYFQQLLSDTPKTMPFPCYERLDSHYL